MRTIQFRIVRILFLIHVQFCFCVYTGYKILGGLLEGFIPAVLYPDKPNSEKLLQLLPPQFTYQGDDLYLKLQSVIDFISGVTDIYAVVLYRKIKGIALPNLK